MREFTAKVERITSGDDWVAFVDLGVDNLWKRTRVRLQGVDAPRVQMGEEDGQAVALKEELKEMLLYRRVRLILHAENKGGWICEVHFPSAPDEDNPDIENGYLNINGMLKRRGYVFEKQNLRKVND